MESKFRTTTRVTTIALICSLVGAILAVGFDTSLMPAVPMFAVFGGFMTLVYQRDRALPVEHKLND